MRKKPNMTTIKRSIPARERVHKNFVSEKKVPEPTGLTDGGGEGAPEKFEFTNDCESYVWMALYLRVVGSSRDEEIIALDGATVTFVVNGKQLGSMPAIMCAFASGFCKLVRPFEVGYGEQFGIELSWRGKGTENSMLLEVALLGLGVEQKEGSRHERD